HDFAVFRFSVGDGGGSACAGDAELDAGHILTAPRRESGWIGSYLRPARFRNEARGVGARTPIRELEVALVVGNRPRLLGERRRQAIAFEIIQNAVPVQIEEDDPAIEPVFLIVLPSIPIGILEHLA